MRRTLLTMFTPVLLALMPGCDEHDFGPPPIDVYEPQVWSSSGEDGTGTSESGDVLTSCEEYQGCTRACSTGVSRDLRDVCVSLCDPPDLAETLDEFVVTWGMHCASIDDLRDGREHMHECIIGLDDCEYLAE